MSRKVKIVKINPEPARKANVDAGQLGQYSAKHQVSESSMLNKYLSSRGINPVFVSRDTKVSHAKSNEFKSWLQNHQLEEVHSEESLNESYLLDRFLLSRGINPTHLSRNLKVSYSKSDAFLKWKQNHMNEQVQEGRTITKTPVQIRKHELKKSKQAGQIIRTNSIHMEEADKKDTITFDIPLLIRVLEFAREDLKSDPDLHRMVERLIEIRNKGVLSMDDYNFIAHLKEEMELDESALEKWRKAAAEREKKHADIEKEMKARHAAGKEDMKGSIDRLQKQLNKEETGLDEMNKANPRHPMYQLDPSLYKKTAKSITKNYATHAGKYFSNTDKTDFTLDYKKTDKEAPRYKNEEVERIEEISKETLKSYQAKRKDSDLMEHKPTSENTLDPLAATQAPSTLGNDDSIEKKRQMSKSARMIKALYKKKGVVKEDMYDHEKEDKSVATYGKKPKFEKTDKDDSLGENKPQAASIMSGGTTLTGAKRDDVEIDPAMRNRPRQPELEKKYNKQENK